MSSNKNNRYRLSVINKNEAENLRFVYVCITDLGNIKSYNLNQAITIQFKNIYN